MNQLSSQVRDGRDLILKQSHNSRPIWILSDGYIYVEAFHPIGQVAIDFLSITAEPISRQDMIHEYQVKF